MNKRGLGLSVEGLWLGGKNGWRVQAETTGCGCRESEGLQMLRRPLCWRAGCLGSMAASFQSWKFGREDQGFFPLFGVWGDPGKQPYKTNLILSL